MSVQLITYNQERYIAQAIEGVLMQRTSFPIELVIGEDCSPDRTREIVVDYARRYPGIIRPLLHEKNLGGAGNWQATLKACRGRYVAFLEGDDFWTSPQKLQRQVEVMDAHPEVSFSCHQVTILNESTGQYDPEYPKGRPTGFYSLEDVLREYFVMSCSTVYRRSLIPPVPDWFFRVIASDWPLDVMMAERGKIAYIDEAMATYRRHAGGAFTRLSREKRVTETLKMLDHLEDYLGGRGRLSIRDHRHRLLREECLYFLKLGDAHGARPVVRRMMTASPLWYCAGQKLKLMLEAYLPGAYNALKRTKDSPATGKTG